MDVCLIQDEINKAVGNKREEGREMRSQLNPDSNGFSMRLIPKLRQTFKDFQYVLQRRGVREVTSFEKTCVTGTTLAVCSQGYLSAGIWPFRRGLVLRNNMKKTVGFTSQQDSDGARQWFTCSASGKHRMLCRPD